MYFVLLCLSLLLALAGGVILRLWLRLESEKAASKPEPKAPVAPTEDDTLRTVMDGVSDPIFSIDGTGRYLFVNRPFAAPFGKMPAEVIGTTLWDLFPKAEADYRFAALSRVMVKGEPTTFEVKVDSVDHGTRFYLTTITPRFDEAGRSLGVLCSSKEITERKRADEVLQQAHKGESLTLMAAGIAHDFNNQFQTLLSSLELVQQRIPEDSREGQALIKAVNVLRHASDLSQRMLEFTGKSLRKSEAFYPATLLRAREGELRRSVEAVSRARFEVELAAGVGHLVDGDAGQVFQVVQALVQNAAEAIGQAEGRIQVRLGVPPPPSTALGWVEPPTGKLLGLSVEDTGPGMTPDVVARVFDPFYSTKTQRGLGLPATLGIIRGHQGALQVSSEPGEGTRFWVGFPLGQEKVKPAPEASAVAASMPGARTILLVDDEDELRAVVSEVIRDLMGLPVLEARDGLEAVDCFTQHADEIALVLMDAKMPRMGGLEAFAAIRRLHPAARGILCSGYGDEFGQATAQGAGFLGFLKKPFPIKVLREAVEKALGA